MDPIRIAFTIPNQSLYIGFGLLVFAITTYLAISNHREKLKHFANPLQWLAENYLWIVLPLGTFAIGFAVYEWIWQILPKVGQIITKLTPATQEPDAIRNLAYAIGALLAAVALSATIPFQLIKVWVNERLAKTTEQGHMTDRITKAVEQLGAEKTIWENGKQKTVPNLEVRLGAIYALERIAQDSLRDHISVMEILCAYVRHNAPASGAVQTDIDYENENWKEKETAELAKIGIPPIDAEAALTVIGRRGTSHISYERNANYNTIKQSYELDLRNCNFQKMDLQNLDFSNALLMRSAMQGVVLHGTKLDSSDLYQSSLIAANLSESNIQDANFAESFLHSTKFVKSNLQGANFREAKMLGADLTNARLRYCNLIKSQLQGVRFRGAMLQGANFRSATLKLANVRKADFSLAKNISDKQIKTMFGDSTSLLPPSLESPAWANWEPTSRQFLKEWRAAKAAANL